MDSKLQLGTSLRSRPALQTVRIAQGLAARLGITAVVDVTSLDRLGMPVFLSVRPDGAVATVHSGKGLLAEDAQVGALMEAVEYAASEIASRAAVSQRLPLSKLAAGWPAGLGVADFAPRLGVAARAHRLVPSVSCELLQTARSAHLPSELVLLPAPPQRSRGLFGSSSNGLASGNTLEEATLHALLEVIERDTVALHLARDESRALVMSSLPTPFDVHANAWRREGVRLHVRFLPNSLGLPCFEAGLHEAAAEQPSLTLSRGWGLHFDRRIALSRAICEAAQSRLFVIVANQPGAPASAELSKRLGAPPSSELTARRLTRLADGRRRTRMEGVPNESTGSIRAALRTLLARLPAVGLGPVFRYRLHLDDNPTSLNGLHVVKVVVARSETPVGEHPRIGPRLLARLQGA